MGLHHNYGQTHLQLMTDSLSHKNNLKSKSEPCTAAGKAEDDKGKKTKIEEKKRVILFIKVVHKTVPISTSIDNRGEEERTSLD